MDLAGGKSRHSGYASVPSQDVHCRGIGDACVASRHNRSFRPRFLNSRLAMRGSDRCCFRENIYHTIDVASRLRVGRNVSAIEGLYIGEYLPSNVERYAAGPTGCLAEFVLDDRSTVWTEGTWCVLRNPACSHSGVCISGHRGWKEGFDAGLLQVPEVFDMRQPTGADSRWYPAYYGCPSSASVAGVLLQICVCCVKIEGRTARIGMAIPMNNVAMTFGKQERTVSVL